MPERLWKTCERKIAAILGGQLVAVLGGNAHAFNNLCLRPGKRLNIMFGLSPCRLETVAHAFDNLGFGLLNTMLRSLRWPYRGALVVMRLGDFAS